MDIGSDSVKAVELNLSGSKISLGFSGVAPIFDGNGTIKEAPGFDPERTVAAIKRLIAESKISTKKVVSCVSGESVIVRILRMPESIFEEEKKENLEFTIKNEARDFIPYDIDDIIFDYQKIASVSGEGGGMIEVLIVAVKKETIQTHLEIIKSAGLRPAIIDVASFALVNALTYGGSFSPNEVVAVVNIGSDITSIAIMRDGMTRFTRDFNVAGKNITNAIMAGLDLTWNTAEEKKKKYGIISPSQTTGGGMGSFGGGQQDLVVVPNSQFDDGSDMNVVSDLSQAIDGVTDESNGTEAMEVSNIIQGVLSDISSEVKRSLLYYESQLEDEQVTKILLGGGTAKMKNIAPFFQGILDVNTEIINPFRGISHQLDEGEVTSLSSLLGVGIGLALRSVVTSKG